MYKMIKKKMINLKMKQLIEINFQRKKNKTIINWLVMIKYKINIKMNLYIILIYFKISINKIKKIISWFKMI